MYPYDENVNALANLLARLSFTDLHRQKFPNQRRYTWNNTTGSRSRIDAMYANAATFEMMGGPTQYKFSIGNTAGPLGTDHSPIFTSFRAPLASPNDGSLPVVFPPPPATPTKLRLDAHKSSEYNDLLVHYRDHPQLHNQQTNALYLFAPGLNCTFSHMRQLYSTCVVYVRRGVSMSLAAQGSVLRPRSRSSCCRFLHGAGAGAGAPAPLLARRRRRALAQRPRRRRRSLSGLRF